MCFADACGNSAKAVKLVLILRLLLQPFQHGIWHSAAVRCGASTKNKPPSIRHPKKVTKFTRLRPIAFESCLGRNWLARDKVTGALRPSRAPRVSLNVCANLGSDAAH